MKTAGVETQALVKPTIDLFLIEGPARHASVMDGARLRVEAAGVNYVKFNVPANPPLDPNTGKPEIMMVDAVVGTSFSASPTGTGAIALTVKAADAAKRAVPSGFELGLVLFELPASKPGRGELVPEAKIRLDDQGAIVTDSSVGVTTQLTDVVRK